MADRKLIDEAVREYGKDGEDFAIFCPSRNLYRVSRVPDNPNWFMWESLSLPPMHEGRLVYSFCGGELGRDLKRTFLSALLFDEQLELLRERPEEMGADLVRAIDPYSMGADTRVMALAWETFGANGGEGLVDRITSTFRTLKITAPRWTTFALWWNTSRVMLGRWEDRRVNIASFPSVPVRTDAIMEALMRTINISLEESYEAGEIDPVLDREETEYAEGEVAEGGEGLSEQWD